MTPGEGYAKITDAFSGHKAICGEMSEWFKEPVLKTGDSARSRGFESHSLRHISFYDAAAMQKYPSGRRGSPAKGVGG